MEEAAGRFTEMSDLWMETMFPSVDGGVEVDVRGWDLKLGTEVLRSSATAPDGYTPAYLKADGTVDLVLRTGSGMAERTVEISADGGSALPLTDERGSVFEG